MATEINQLDSTITALDLRNSGLTTMPPSVFEQKQLKVLILSQNYFGSLSREIKKLVSLQALILNNTGLKELPIEIGLLSNLQILNLERNQLITIPEEIGNLTSLQTFRAFRASIF